MSAARRTPERYLMARTDVPVVMGWVVWEVAAAGPEEERARVEEPPGARERDMVVVVDDLKASESMEGKRPNYGVTNK